MRRLVYLLCLPLLFAAVTGCGHKSDRAPLDTALTQPSDDAGTDKEAQLRGEVHKRIEIAARTEAEDKQRVIRRTPYWYKEFAEYPSGSDDFKVETAVSESRTIPMTATVTIDKTRFSTRLHRDRGEAVSDDNFLRDTGTEHLSFEYRNGRWLLNGSTFVADRSEENINGTWTPVQETTQRTVAAEEKPGWFSRTWSTITGK